MFDYLILTIVSVFYLLENAGVDLLMTSLLVIPKNKKESINNQSIFN